MSDGGQNDSEKPEYTKQEQAKSVTYLLSTKPLQNESLFLRHSRYFIFLMMVPALSFMDCIIELICCMRTMFCAIWFCTAGS